MLCDGIIIPGSGKRGCLPTIERFVWEEHMKYWLRPAVIAGIYAFFGLIWILVTDWISVHWLSEVAETAFVQTVKGTIYILVTAALVYLLTRKLTPHF